MADEAERRHGDRRSSNRRRAPLPSDESLFGAAGLDEGGGTARDSRFGNGWQQPTAGADGVDSRFLTRQARRLSAEGRGAFERIYRAFVGARAALGIALLATQVLGALFAPPASQAALLLCLFYAAQTLSLWMLPRFRRLPDGVVALPRATWLATIGFDLVAFIGLHLLDPSPGLSRAALLVLPVLMAGVLTTRVRALATAAGVTLLLLLDAARPALGGGDIAASLTQAGFAGIGFFGLTLLAGELAGRLAREELTARGSIELARQQAQLNRLVIEEMVDGVLVVDRRGRVRAANPAARRLLVADGLGPAAPFQLGADTAWAKLARVVEKAFEAGSLEGTSELTLVFANGATRGLRVRARFTRRRASSGESDEARAAQEVYCVLFVEDQRVVEARTRQEKLAAMGRVSAGIAHEIRNPLAAISQANALLQEDIVAPDQQRLAQMVADNVLRLQRIVADVLDVAPGTPPTPAHIDAVAGVAAVVRDWSRAAGMAAAGRRLQVDLPAAPLTVVFDPEHLRRVIVNLLDNAHRHASSAAGAIHLTLGADAQRVRLVVTNDGTPIAPDIERHLFEPFFSTRSRGSGLGLYICRELCERYGASIDFRLAPPGEPRRNQFHVSMARAASLQPQPA